MDLEKAMNDIVRKVTRREQIKKAKINIITAFIMGILLRKFRNSLMRK